MPYPDIDPVAFVLFGWPVHWYGVMYALAFASAAVIGRKLLRRPAFAGNMGGFDVDDLLLTAVIGVLLGGRLGYVLFYQPAFYIEEPLRVLQIWQGGMSFHGGLLGAILAIAWYARRCKLPFWRVADFAAVITPPGLGFGRLGNFINGELPGRIAPDWLPWRLVYNHVDDMARHPSALYQALLEGVLLFAVLYWLSKRQRRDGFIAAFFLAGYGACRLLSEFFREPDAHLGLLWGGLSMGQWLSLPMLLAGAVVFWRMKKARV